MMFNVVVSNTGGSYSTVNHSRGFVGSHIGTKTEGVEVELSCPGHHSLDRRGMRPALSQATSRYFQTHSIWDNDGDTIDPFSG